MDELNLTEEQKEKVFQMYFLLRRIMEESWDGDLMMYGISEVEMLKFMISVHDIIDDFLYELGVKEIPDE